MNACEFVQLRNGCIVPVAAVRLALDLEARGWELIVDGDSILIGPKDRITDDDRAGIRQWRQHLRAILTMPPSLPVAKRYLPVNLEHIRSQKTMRQSVIPIEVLSTQGGIGSRPLTVPNPALGVGSQAGADATLSTQVPSPEATAGAIMPATYGKSGPTNEPASQYDTIKPIPATVNP